MNTIERYDHNLNEWILINIEFKMYEHAISLNAVIYS